MRDTIIKIAEVLIWVAGALVAIIGIIGGIVAIVQGELAGLGAIFAAPLVAIIYMAGFFIFIGNYYNRRRIADAVEKLAARG
ncbi:hypothetical protein [Vannielia sp.]|uniref:hypothetical protein n=1 Tax=Vannielia sp. TaxID=2813045 RepID=UPI002617055F|nr:hypothetical protein [Vannielia sp.]MDF1871089.1 hypothetical protein [Vannielia sp.]